ncbi:hypothetical protein JRQ81_018707 [Phrynocephalus forsythii]|uniref:Uncharacterized protein n=1 Tax=Phrynocephalus forsythii TaxID=171643 RepID=A0A9Q0XPQ6_9SAUR|nr:hypothetical protein JRQ81_018707 [Phrynocephalus forsythii]
MAAEEVTGGARKATKSKLFEFLVHGVRPGMPSGARMPHQGAPMGPPGPPYVGSPSVRPGMPQAVMEPTRKRAAPQQAAQQQAAQQQQVQQATQQQQQAAQQQQQAAQQQQQQAAQQQAAATQNRPRSAKRRKMADKILPQRLLPRAEPHLSGAALKGIGECCVFWASWWTWPDMRFLSFRKVMTDVVGNPEEERRAEFYHEPWSQEAVSRYFYCKIQQRRQELEQSLGVRNT